MKFRRAQHTSNLGEIVQFYTSILGFKILGEFKNHDGYNGVFLGFANENWELEFTEDGSEPNHSRDEDDLIVFYPETTQQFESVIARIHEAQLPIFEPKNSYWKTNGTYIKDPDGFGIIVVKPHGQ